jgi:hypothetical protein
MGGGEKRSAPYPAMCVNALRMNAVGPSMWRVVVLLLLMIVPPICCAQEASVPEPVPVEAKLPRLKLSVAPPLDAVQAALDATLLVGDVRVKIRVTHDAEGVVSRAEVQGSSGDNNVDDALSVWAQQARIVATVAGEGLINLRLETGNVALSIPRVVKAASTWGIEQALRESHLVRLDTSALVTVDGKGKATAVDVMPTTRDKPLDAAIVTWAMRNRYSPGTMGVVQLPLRLNMNLLGNARALEVRILAPPDLVIVDQPSVGSIGRAFSNSFLDEASFDADIEYAADGRVTRVRMSGPTSSITIRQTIQEWIERLRIRPGKSGASRIRVIVQPE